MDIKTDSSQMRLTINEKEFFLSMPKLKHQLIIDEIVALADQGKSATKKIIELLGALGLPEEIILELEDQDFLDILKGLADAKKKRSMGSQSLPS